MLKLYHLNLKGINDSLYLKIRNPDGGYTNLLFQCYLFYNQIFFKPEFAGGGGADTFVACIGFYEALEKAGIRYNEELYKAYKDWYARYKDESPYAGGIVGDDGAAIWDLSDAGSRYESGWQAGQAGGQ